ncbi:MAG: hypothetical protein ACXWIN_08065 [Burkholderiaceae bacterium]
MKERFEKLIREFCAEVKLRDPEKLINGAPFTVNQVDFSLSHKPHLNPELLFVHVDLGEIPKGREVEAYYALLRENYFDFSLTNSSVSISSATGRAVYAAVYLLDKFGKDDLLVALTTLSYKSKQWQTDNSSIHQKTALGAANKRPYYLPSWIPTPKNIGKKARGLSELIDRPLEKITTA